MSTCYGDDLAWIHDVGFGQFARHAATVLIDTLRSRGRHGGTILDLGCGSGILAERLHEAGYSVIGFDLSPAMLDLARRRVPEARFFQASILDVDLPPCLAVTAIGECLNYQFDPEVGPGSLPALLARIHSALDLGGLFLFDLAEPGRVPEPGLLRSHRLEPDWAVLVTAEENRAQRRLVRRITSFRRIPEGYRRHDEEHRLHLMPRSEMRSLLAATGFQVEATDDGYGALRFPPGLVAFLATRTVSAGATPSPDRNRVSVPPEL